MGYEHFRLDNEDIINHAKSKGNKSDWYRTAVEKKYFEELQQTYSKQELRIRISDA